MEKFNCECDISKCIETNPWEISIGTKTHWFIVLKCNQIIKCLENKIDNHDTKRIIINSQQWVEK